MQDSVATSEASFFLKWLKFENCFAKLMTVFVESCFYSNIELLKKERTGNYFAYLTCIFHKEAVCELQIVFDDTFRNLLL